MLIMVIGNELFFDREQELNIHLGGSLPHWHQRGKIQYVTFRLADSLAAVVRHELDQVIRRFREHHPEPWDENTIREYHNLIGPRTEQLLHNGYGSCVLRRPDIRNIVSEALTFRDNVDYTMLMYVIMPNHVHMLILVGEDPDLKKILHSIKGFTATMINKKLGRKGAFWCPESFDRIVRSNDHLKHCIHYILHNPDSLPPTDYTLYIHPIMDGGHPYVGRGHPCPPPLANKVTIIPNPGGKGGQ